MNRVVAILMKRDGITEEQATELVQETREDLINADPFEAEDIVASNLGLEMDYLLDIFDIQKENLQHDTRTTFDERRRRCAA